MVQNFECGFENEKYRRWSEDINEWYINYVCGMIECCSTMDDTSMGKRCSSGKGSTEQRTPSSKYKHPDRSGLHQNIRWALGSKKGLPLPLWSFYWRRCCQPHPRPWTQGLSSRMKKNSFLFNYLFFFGFNFKFDLKL